MSGAALKVLIISDTHRRDHLFPRILDAEAPIDMLVHAGDLEGSEFYYEAMTDAEFHCVAGNNDLFSDVPDEDEFMIGPLKAFLVHGHQYRISMTDSLLIEKARSRGAQVLIYGHTHRPVAENRGGLLVLNPGSLTYPRPYGNPPSYIVLTVSPGGEGHAEIRYVG